VHDRPKGTATRRKREKVSCSCGARVQKTSLSRHLGTEKHKREYYALRFAPIHRGYTSAPRLPLPLRPTVAKDKSKLEKLFPGEKLALRNSLREQNSSQATTLALQVRFLFIYSLRLTHQSSERKKKKEVQREKIF